MSRDASEPDFLGSRTQVVKRNGGGERIGRASRPPYRV